MTNNSNNDDGDDVMEFLQRSKSQSNERPLTLEERYQILDDLKQATAVFAKMAQELVGLCDKISNRSHAATGRSVVLREIGRTSDRRSYFFMKPFNDYGWLIEQNGPGWRISRAEKIVGQDLFMRSHQDPWDLATLWHDPLGQGSVRVKSQKFSYDLMTISDYDRRLKEAFAQILVASVEP